MAGYQLSFVGVLMTFPVALEKHLDRSDLGKGGLFWSRNTFGVFGRKSGW